MQIIEGCVEMGFYMEPDFDEPLDPKKVENIIELTDDLKKELLCASDEWKKGNVVSQSEMDGKVEEWLSGM